MRAEISVDSNGRRFVKAGLTPAKVLSLLVSLAIFAVGLLELSWTARRVWGVPREAAKVVAIEVEAPGTPRREYVPESATALSNATVFTYWVECATPAGRLELNVSNKGAPTYAVGDTVEVAVAKNGERLAIAVGDFRTWVIGVFITAVGLCYLVVTISILWRGRTPVEIPAGDTL